MFNIFFYSGYYTAEANFAHAVFLILLCSSLLSIRMKRAYPNMRARPHDIILFVRDKQTSRDRGVFEWNATKKYAERLRCAFRSTLLKLGPSE